MNQNSNGVRGNTVALLRKLARSKSGQEQCDFCNAALPPDHRHLLEVSSTKIICACDACALRFEGVIGRYKLIPRDPRRLENFRMSDEQWESLALPIHLAFFFHSTPAKRTVAMYPSPAGAMESLLPLENWRALEQENPELSRMEPDVEALLLNRLGSERLYCIAPIDQCYELAGLLRLHWRGLSGGEVVWQKIREFFTKLRTQAGIAEEPEALATNA
ncbi:MAG TPA: DUF5947 family protein [Verrucomicrobiae bacterium]|nr:DUF5947 family protein [Verrucomicrobiae bacterium]